jgi:hypothetical protein
MMNGRHHHDEDTRHEVAWDQPVNFLRELSAAPFERADVPAEISGYAFAYAQQTGFDPTITVLSAVTAAAAALSDGFKLVADSGTGWMQPAVLWSLIIGPSGSGKSPAQKAMLKPLNEIQRALLADYQRTKDAAKDGDDKVKRPRIIVNDATIEALSEVLRDNERGVLVATDEFESFLGSLDQYRRGAASRDRGEWLRLFDGGPHTVERVQRGSVYVPNFGASLLTSTTPTVLQKVAKLLPEDGLLQRFLVGIARRQIESAPVADVQHHGDDFGELLRRLYAAQPNMHSGAVPMMTMTRQTFDAWRARHSLIQEGFDHMDPSLGAHLAKFPTFALRLALTFHASRNVMRPDEADRDPAKWPLLPETVNAALRFLARARQHSMSLYLTSRNGSEVFDLAREIAHAVLAIGLPVIQRRDLQQRCWAFKKADEREQNGATDLMVDFGWLRPADTGYRKGHSTRFDVNPALPAKFADIARRERERRAFVREEIERAAHDRR